MNTPRALPSWPHAVYGCIRKDLALTWRSAAQINAGVFFGVLVLLLFSFAVGPQQHLLERLAPGFLWLAVLLASVLHLNASVHSEIAHNALEGLRLLPVPSSAIYLGKAVSNTLYLTLLGALLLPVSAALYGVSLPLGLKSMGAVLVLGSMAISGPGTLYAYIASHMRSKDALLPLLLFPVLVPGLLASVKATALVMHSDPMHQWSSWLWLLAGFNAVYWTLSSLLFRWVIEDET
jgi:heme exporter protein B